MVYKLVHQHTEREVLVINESEFLEIKKLKHVMLTILNIEEKYNMLLENYVEYESTMLDIGLNQAVFANYAWTSLLDQIYTMSRRIINLLTTSRLYLDHIYGDVKDITSPEASQRVKEKANEEYDAHLSYRIMEALRNYVQHKGLPVDNIRFDTERVSDEQHRYKITLSLKVTKLRGSGFKSSVLQEMTNLTPDLELKLPIREYMDSLACIHRTVRDEVSELLVTYEKIFKIWQQKYSDATEQDKQKMYYLTAVAYNSDKIIEEKITLVAEIFPRHNRLIVKNTTYTDFSMQNITSEH